MSWARILAVVAALVSAVTAPSRTEAETEVAAKAGGQAAAKAGAEQVEKVEVDKATKAAGAAAERRRSPVVKSVAVVVLEADGGREVWSKDADEVREIASMTKIFVALVLRQKRLKLDEWSTIGPEDVAAAEGGARTRLPEGETFRNLDLLKAMLMVSDNRAPTALARSVGLDRDGLVAAMNAYAAALGLTHTRFKDPTGIDGNVSTARELARALAVVLDDKVLAKLMRITHVRIWSKARTAKADYRSTVQPLHDGIYKVRGGKTGHTDAAGYCLLVSPVIDGKPYVMAFLGGKKKNIRFDDFGRVATWVDLADGTSSAKVGKRASAVAASGGGAGAGAEKPPAAKTRAKTAKTARTAKTAK